MKKFYAKLSISVFSFFILFSPTILAQQSLYNGQIPISVPIHTVDNGRTQVPIRLDYDGSGVKPNQHPGWTGMNWNLNAGGAVVREVKGLPDDHVSLDAVQYGDNTTLKIGYAINQIVDVRYTDHSCYVVYCEFKTKSFGNNTHEGDDLLVNRSGLETKAGLDTYCDNMYPNDFEKNKLFRDSEPDIFNFYLPNGLSGKFFFKQGNPYEFIVQGNKKFNGTIYYLTQIQKVP